MEYTNENSMSVNLRWLLWAVCLVVTLNYLLGQQDGLHELEKERKTLQSLKMREAGAAVNIAWPAELIRARLVRDTWMERLPLYATRGLLNAGVLESMGAICNELKLACQVALNDEAASSSKPAASAAFGASAPKLTDVSPMFSSTEIKVTAPFQPEDLVALLSRLESADQLRSIERIAVSGARMEFTVRVYAVDASRGSRKGSPS